MAVNVMSILLLFISFYCVYSDEIVPVLLWEPKSDSNGGRFQVPALSQMNDYSFEDLLVKKTKGKNLVLLFVEETLCVEDFSWRSETGEGSFPNIKALSSMEQLIYLPQVQEPMNILYNLPQQGPQWHHSVLLPNGLDMELSTLDPEEHYLLINFEDAKDNESRMDMLKRHDAFIDKTYKKLKGERNLLALYTSYQSLWHSGEESRKIREVGSESPIKGEQSTTESTTPESRIADEPDEKSGSCTAEYCLFGANSSVTIYAAPPPNITYKGEQFVLNGSFTTDLKETYATELSPLNGTILFTVAFEKVLLRFNFSLYKTNYWQLEDVYTELSTNDGIENGTLKYNRTDGIQAPFRFSYHCNSSHNNFSKGVKNDDMELKFVNLQVQAYLRMNEATKLWPFGDAYDCVPFMTIPILSGLFITGFLGVILIWGLKMILNIKTMDRFDDPKGKTITINAGE